MFSISEGEFNRDFIFSSDLKLVDRVILECRNFVQAGSSVNSTHFEHVLRELLINAIEHGNGSQTQKRVWCTVERIGEIRFKITVKDEGPGFDLHKILLANTNDPHQVRNRGYTIVNMYADEIKSDENSGITVFLTLQRSVLFPITKENETVTLSPSGDLSASNADNFREALLESLKFDPSTLCLDFGSVRNIDSICLSILALLSKSAAKDRNHLELAIKNVSAEIRDLFRLTRLDSIYRLSGEVKV